MERANLKGNDVHIESHRVSGESGGPGSAKDGEGDGYIGWKRGVQLENMSKALKVKSMQNQVLKETHNVINGCSLCC